MTLAEAIRVEDWPRALVLALDEWRASRSCALADLIDALSQRCTRPYEDHAAWMTAAEVYDPIVASSLVAHASTRARKCDVTWEAMRARLVDDPTFARVFATTDGREPPRYQRNRIERLCAMASWPADPRLAILLAHWFVDEAFTWDEPFADGALVVLEIIADELIRIGDARVIARLTSTVTYPSGPSARLRAHQQQLARRIIDAIPAAPPDDPAIVEAHARIALPPRPSADALWEAVLAEPEALAPRLVLADFLQEQGDPRGELIALQCANDPRSATRVAQLLRAHRNTWLADLSILDRKQTTFEAGMIAVAVIGHATTPEWAYAACAGHRELALATTVRIRHASEALVAPILAGMSPHRPLALERVRIGTLHVIAAARSRLPLRALGLRHGACTAEELERDLALLPAMCPELAELGIYQWRQTPAHVAALRALKALPALRVRVEVHGAYNEGFEGLDLPHLEVIEI